MTAALTANDDGSVSIFLQISFLFPSFSLLQPRCCPGGRQGPEAGTCKTDYSRRPGRAKAGRARSPRSPLDFCLSWPLLGLVLKGFSATFSQTQRRREACMLHLQNLHQVIVLRTLPPRTGPVSSAHSLRKVSYLQAGRVSNICT